MKIKKRGLINMKLFNRNFIMVLIGQIISLFGNTILRFALPLYLLNQTESASLFGIVSACAFIPMIFITPIGGIIADRVNKRNIMVILDFSTAIITLVVMLFLGKVNLIILLLSALILLYGIQGAYQPAVQASMPVLVPSDGIMQANSLVNIISSLSSLIGPVIGGMLFGFLGIKPILLVSVICFLISAIMEIFIIIPVTKKDKRSGVFNIVICDMKESFKFIFSERPEILKGSLIISAFNLVLSACIMIGLPVIITQKMGFQLEIANRLYGYMEGAMGAGSLAGGILGGIFAKKVKIKNCSLLLIICSLSILPITLVLSFNLPSITAYIIIMISSFVMMMLATLFSIQLMSCLQVLTPNKLLGKVISCVMCISMCATPIGQAFYGIIFQKFSDTPQIVFLGALTIGVIIGICTIKLFRKLEEIMNTNYSEI